MSDEAFVRHESLIHISSPRCPVVIPVLEMRSCEPVVYVYKVLQSLTVSLLFFLRY